MLRHGQAQRYFPNRMPEVGSKTGAGQCMWSKVDDRAPLNDQRSVIAIRDLYTGFRHLLPCAMYGALSLV